MKLLTTALTLSIAQDHIAKHIGFLADVTGAIEIDQGKGWLGQFPSDPGVYCIFKGNALLYVGETGSLKRRMGDLLRTKKHTLRRKLGKEKFGTHQAYQSASTKRKYPDEIEQLLTAFMLEHLKVKVVLVALGRKEIEERIIEEKTPKFNG